MNPQSPWPSQTPPPQQPAAIPHVPSAYSQPAAAPALPTTPIPPSQFNAPQPQAPSSPLPTVASANFSASYLDEIATPTASKAPNKFAIIGLIGGVLLAALFAVLLIGSSKSPDSTEQLTAIGARVATLQTVVTAQQKNLSGNAIAEANATLGSTLTTMNSDMTAFLPKKTNDTSKSKAATDEKTYATELAAKLDSAYQRGMLDRTYTVQMTYELTVLRGMLQKLKKNTTTDAIKTFCTTSSTNIDIILKQYAEFDASKS